MKKQLIWMFLFAAAMGLLESAVVVYLRILYYPNGFSFPLVAIPLDVARVEVWREVATIIMLIGAGIMAGKTPLQRFAYFILAFGIWDIFYYVFLYLFIGWPQSLATWDILFLIPMPWVGPVWAPCLVSALLIVGAIYVIKSVEENKNLQLNWRHWLFTIGGACVCIFSFMYDYIFYAQNGPSHAFASNDLFVDLRSYVPQQFNYLLFITGFLLMAIPLPIIYLKNKNK